MVRIVSDTSTLYSPSQTLKILQDALPGAVFAILSLSPAFITQGGPGCVAVQVIQA